MKWLPPPSVPSWCTQFECLPMRLPMPRVLAEDLVQAGFWNALAACERASRSPCCPNPTGTSRDDLVEDLVQRRFVQLVGR